MKLTHRRRRGATVMVAIIACALFLGFLMSALFSSAQLGSTGSTKLITERQARYAAYAGIQRSFVELEKDETWRAGWSVPQPLHQQPNFAYTVDADDTPDGLGADEVFLFAEGYPGTDQEARAIAAYAGTAYRPGKIFTEAAFGYSGISLSGTSITDAYDSTSGYSGGTKEGSIGSTETVTLSDTAEVQGDVILAQPHLNITDPNNPPAPPAPASLVKGPMATLTGAEVQDGKRIQPTFSKPYDDTPSVVIDDVNSLLPADPGPDAVPTLEPGTYKSVNVGPGKTLQLKDGEYYISETLTLEDARLVIPVNAEVKLFIGNSMTASNSKVNPPDYDDQDKMTNKLRPEDLCIFFLDEGVDPVTGDQIASTFSSADSVLNCAIAGTKLHAELTNDTILFGAVSGGSVGVSDSKLHYDKSLEDADMSGYTGWQLRNLSAEPPRP